MGVFLLQYLPLDKGKLPGEGGGTDSLDLGNDCSIAAHQFRDFDRF